jgi:hypothetical protein
MQETRSALNSSMVCPILSSSSEKGVRANFVFQDIFWISSISCGANDINPLKIVPTSLIKVNIW